MVLSFHENKKGHGFCAHGLSVTPYACSAIDCLKRTGGGYVWKGKGERGPEGSIMLCLFDIHYLCCLSFSQTLIYGFLRNVKKTVCQPFFLRSIGDAFVNFEMS
jgi:hypothetical protein